MSVNNTPPPSSTGNLGYGEGAQETKATSKTTYSSSKEGLVVISSPTVPSPTSSNVSSLSFNKLNEIVPAGSLTVGFGSDQILIDLMKQLLTAFTSISANRQLSANIDLQNFVQAAITKLKSSQNEADHRQTAAVLQAVVSIVGSLAEAGISASSASASGKKVKTYDKQSKELGMLNAPKTTGKQQVTPDATPAPTPTSKSTKAKPDVETPAPAHASAKKTTAGAKNAEEIGETAEQKVQTLSDAEKDIKKKEIESVASNEAESALQTQYHHTALMRTADAAVKSLSILSADYTHDADQEKIRADFASTIMNIFSQGENMNTQACDKVKELLASVIQFLAELIRNMAQTEKSIGTSV